MASRNPESTAQVAGHPIHPMLIPFPVAFLVATLVSDLSSFEPATRAGRPPRSGCSARRSSWRRSPPSRD
jgi:uncharacterized membrane protein